MHELKNMNIPTTPFRTMVEAGIFLQENGFKPADFDGDIKEETFHLHGKEIPKISERRRNGKVVKTFINGTTLEVLAVAKVSKNYTRFPRSNGWKITLE